MSVQPLSLRKPLQKFELREVEPMSRLLQEHNFETKLIYTYSIYENTARQCKFATLTFCSVGHRQL